jgi:hypothetical protein
LFPKLSSFRTNFLLSIFCKLQWRVPFSDVVAQWIEHQIASGVVPGSNSGIFEARTSG